MIRKLLSLQQPLLMAIEISCNKNEPHFFFSLPHTLYQYSRGRMAMFKSRLLYVVHCVYCTLSSLSGPEIKETDSNSHSATVNMYVIS